jgi:plastocyanin
MAVRRAVAAWAAAIVISCALLATPLIALAATSAVNIQGFAFSPTPITVHVGDRVTWTNRDAVAHTTTSDTGAWNSGSLVTGGSFSFTFTSAGTFAYHCAIHTAMTGTVVVQAVSTPQPTAPPPPTAPPTPVRTAPPPTIAPTAPPTPAPTEAPTPLATTAAPTATASPAAAATATESASPSPVAAQVTPAPASSGGTNAQLIVVAAAIAVLALGAIAFFLARRA